MKNNNEIKEETFYQIPTSVMMDRRLTPNAKLLLGVIKGLSKKHGYCFASSAFLGEQMGITRSGVNKNLKTLKELGYISCELTKQVGSNLVKQRKIFVKDTPTPFVPTPVSNGSTGGLIGSLGRHEQAEVIDNKKKEYKEDSPSTNEPTIVDDSNYEYPEGEYFYTNKWLDIFFNNSYFNKNWNDNPNIEKYKSKQSLQSVQPQDRANHEGFKAYIMTCYKAYEDEYKAKFNALVDSFISQHRNHPVYATFIAHFFTNCIEKAIKEYKNKYKYLPKSPCDDNLKTIILELYKTNHSQTEEKYQRLVDFLTTLDCKSIVYPDSYFNIYIDEK